MVDSIAAPVEKERRSRDDEKIISRGGRQFRKDLFVRTMTLAERAIAQELVKHGPKPTYGRQYFSRDFP